MLAALVVAWAPAAPAAAPVVDAVVLVAGAAAEAGRPDAAPSPSQVGEAGASFAPVPAADAPPATPRFEKAPLFVLHCALLR